MDKEDKKHVKYPGVRDAMDGNTVVIMCEREASDAAGAYPITPSTQMGEYWAQETAKGHINVSGRPLIFIEPEGEHAAAAVTAGMSMTGLRAVNFSSGQGIAYMHESLYAAVGKRLPYVLNIGCRAITKHSLNVHAGHDDYHCIDDTGFFQVMAKSAQEVADLNIISHKIAELSLNPGAVGQDGFLTTHLIESLLVPERELIAEYLGRPEDIIESPTAAQRMLFGPTRRRVPELWDVDNPVMAGVVQNQDSYMQGVAAQRPYFFEHVQAFADQCFAEYSALTGRKYARVNTYKIEDADYLIIGQGSVVSSAEVVADYLRETRGLKVGVLNVIMFRPFPSDLIGQYVKGRKGIVVLERTDQPLAVDLPLAREIRATISKCIENGIAEVPFPAIETYQKATDAPPLYSASFGMGSRDLQPEGLIGAVENMLPNGKKQKFFYLGMDFIHEKAFTAAQDAHQKAILEAYPHVKSMGLHGSENPNLMPKGAITVRFHSVGGWGAITTGKNLAMTLFDLLGYHIKANPKYGSEKKGQPTTYYLSAAPEPIRINCEYFYVDVVLSPDPNVFGHSNPLAGLKKGGVFVIQSDLESPQAVWKRIPQRFQKIILDNNIKVFYLDAFKIAREEASDPELQFRMQGNVFQGAFFKASPVMANANLTEETLFKAIADQLQHKFGAKGARIVEDNVRVVRRGYEEAKEITEKTLGSDAVSGHGTELEEPMMLQIQPESAMANTDIHRFWEQVGSFYLSGKGGDTLADPFVSMSCIPVATGIFRDMTQIRFEHPEWDAEKCTGCAACWTICPDSALPGLVNTIDEIFNTTVKQLEADGHPVKLLPKAAGMFESKLRELVCAASEKDPVQASLMKAIDETVAGATLPEAEKTELAKEFELFRALISTFRFGSTKPYFKIREKKEPGSGGLLSVTVNPYTCKGCMECVRVCPQFALRPVTQTEETVTKLRKNWEYWMKLPSTKPDYMLIHDLDQAKGTLETLLLNKKSYMGMIGGDGACVGCGEKTALHLFTATVEGLMQPRVKKFVAKIDDLTAKLEKHIHDKLIAAMSVADTPAFQRAMASLEGREMTLDNLTAALKAEKLESPLDMDWLRRVTTALAQLKQLKWAYTTGVTGKGRASMGMINSTGCTSVWASTFPYNPYPFPWANHLFQDSSSMAMGIFEGHMVKMATGFKAARIAELEIEGRYDAKKHDNFFTYFNWRNFSDEEFKLCPPVVAVGGDGSMFDIGFQNVSRVLMSGKPVKIFIVDTQVYSNTGGQACTSGFTGQISDMAEYGKAFQGKEEIRKEIGLIAMAHRTSFVLNGSISNPSNLIEGYIRGLNSRHPALFNVYTPCMPEHGIGDDVAKQQAKLAVESRAFPLYTYDPDKGKTFQECLGIEGNPAMDKEWPTYTLNYIDAEKKQAKLTIPLTFADFAVTESRFRKQFKKAPVDTWNETMLPIADFLNLSCEDRKGKFPFVWVVDKKHNLGRMIVAEPVVKACEERRDFWALLKSIVEKKQTVDPEKLAKEIRAEVIAKVSATLNELSGGAAPKADSPKAEVKAAASAGNGYKPPTIEAGDCSACGECVQINPRIFGWNAEKIATILDPKGGPYKDIVKAAQKCPAQAINPGTPAE